MKHFLTCFLAPIALHFTAGATPAQNPELVVQAGHSASVKALAFSPDGGILATGSEDCTIILWDVHTARQFRTLRGHTFWVNTLAFSPDGKLLASGSGDGTLRIWDVGAGKELRSIILTDPDGLGINSVAFSPDGRLLAAAGSKKLVDDNSAAVTVWNPATGDQVGKMDADTSVDSVAFSPNGKILATADFDGTIKFWNPTTCQLLRTLGRAEPVKANSMPDFVKALAFSRNGSLLISGGKGSNLTVWDANSGQKIRTLDGGVMAGDVTAIALDSNSHLVAGATSGLNDSDNLVTLWDIESGSRVASLSGAGLSLTFSPDGSLLAVGGQKETRFWDVAARKEIQVLASRSNLFAPVAYTAAGRFLAMGGDDGAIRLWDTASGQISRTLASKFERLGALTIDPHGKTLAVASIDDRHVQLWDTVSGQPLRILTCDTASMETLCFSPDGKILATADHLGGSAGTILLWDTATGQVVRSIPAPNLQVKTLAFSPDGRRIAAGILAVGRDRRKLELWDLTTGELIRQLPVKDRWGVDSVAFSPDGQQLAVGGQSETVEIWDAASGTLLHSMPAGGHHVQVAFSPDGKTLLSAAERQLKLWDPGTGSPLWSSTVDAPIRNLSFNPDGKTFAAGTSSDTAIIGDSATGKPVVTLIPVSSEDYVAAAPDGFYSASRGAAGAVAFRIGSGAFPAEQFDLKYNRPDIILQRLGKAPPEMLAAYADAYQKRLVQMKFAGQSLHDSFELPVVRLVSPALPVTTEQKSLTFTIRASDSLHLLDRLNVFVNDVPVYGIRGIDLRSKNVKTLDQPITLDLSSGSNKIQVSALNQEGVESLQQTFEVTSTAPRARPDIYVVAIGVSDYVNPSYHLTYADQDALAQIDYWKGRKGEFATVQVLPILNREATRENITAARNFLAKSHVDDQVIVFLAGHGLRDHKNVYYFGTTDVDFAHPELRGLSYDSLEGLLDGIPARRKLLLMDTCSSGEQDPDAKVVETVHPAPAAVGGGNIRVRSFTSRGISPAMAPVRSELTVSLLKELFSDLRRGSGAQVIASSGGEESALEGPEWKHGVFTYAVVQGLQTGAADLNHDGQVTVSELRDYVTSTVQDLTEGRQNPIARRESRDYDFPLALRPGIAQAMQQAGAVHALAFAADGKTLASAGDNSAVTLWNPADGALLRTLEGRSSSFPAIEFTPTGALVASGGSDEPIKLWDPTTGKNLLTVGGGWMNYQSAFSADARLLAQAYPMSPIQIWDVPLGKQRRQIPVPKETAVQALTFSPDGKLLAVILDYDTLTLSDPATGAVMAAPTKDWKFIAAAAFSPDSEILAGGLDNTTVDLWNARTGALIRKLQQPDSKTVIRSLAYSNDGKRLAAGGEDGIVRMWDIATGKLLASFEGHARAVTAIAFSPNGALVASGDPDGKIRLFALPP